MSKIILIIKLSMLLDISSFFSTTLGIGSFIQGLVLEQYIIIFLYYLPLFFELIILILWKKS